MSETVTAPVFFFDGSSLSDVVYTKWLMTGEPGERHSVLAEPMTFELSTKASHAVVELPYGCFVLSRQKFRAGEVTLQPSSASGTLDRCYHQLDRSSDRIEDEKRSLIR